MSLKLLSPVAVVTEQPQES